MNGPLRPLLGRGKCRANDHRPAGHTLCKGALRAPGARKEDLTKEAEDDDGTDG